MNEVEAYLRKAAMLRGMDPDAIVRVAKTEGGLSDPFKQSDVVKNGRRERSYGPLQLYIDGGVGNRAMAAGIDPRTDWQGGIDFGLDVAAKEGWGQWYGPQNAGLPLDYGLRGSRPLGLSLASVGPDGPKGQESYPKAAPALSPPRTIRDYPVAEAPTAVADASGLEALKGILGGDNNPITGGLGDMASAFGGGSESSTPQVQPSSIGPAVSSEIAAKAATAQAMMQSVLEARRKRRVPGLSLMG